jgi:hypothetical protein
LPLDLLGGEFFEVAAAEVGGVVDQYVDAAEALDRGPRRGLGLGGAGDVEPDDQQVVRLPDGSGDRVGVAAGGDDPVPAASAALAKSTPMPRPAPVMNQTLLMLLLLLAGRILALNSFGVASGSVFWREASSKRWLMACRAVLIQSCWRVGRKMISLTSISAGWLMAKATQRAKESAGIAIDADLRVASTMSGSLMV